MLAAISYHPLVDVELGPLSISPHGLGIALGFVAGARLMLPEAARKGISEDDVYPLLVRAAIGSIIGARLAYVVNHLNDYDSALDVLKVWQGGISLLGGFFGAILLALPEMRRRGISFWKQMDASAPGMALGVVIGRIGDLIVGDHLGKVTSLPFGYRCPPADVDTASPCLPGTVVHQTALYDLVATVVLLAVLLFLRRRARYDGFLIILFAFWYGIQRIGEDFLREDVRHFGLTGSQITSVVTVAVCGAWLLLGRRTPRWGRWDEREPEPEPEPAAVIEGGTATGAVATSEPAVATSEPGVAPPEPPPPPPEPPPPPAEPASAPEAAAEGDGEGESGPQPPTMTTPPEDRREE